MLIRNGKGSWVHRTGVGFLLVALTLGMTVSIANAGGKKNRAAFERILIMERDLLLTLGQYEAAVRVEDGLDQLDLLTNEELSVLDPGPAIKDLEESLVFLGETIDESLGEKVDKVELADQDNLQ